jgi:hypothetical protein
VRRVRVRGAGEMRTSLSTVSCASTPSRSSSAAAIASAAAAASFLASPASFFAANIFSRLTLERSLTSPTSLPSRAASASAATRASAAAVARASAAEAAAALPSSRLACASRPSACRARSSALARAASAARLLSSSAESRPMYTAGPLRPIMQRSHRSKSHTPQLHSASPRGICFWHAPSQSSGSASRERTSGWRWLQRGTDCTSEHTAAAGLDWIGVNVVAGTASPLPVASAGFGRAGFGCAFSESASTRGRLSAVDEAVAAGTGAAVAAGKSIANDSAGASTPDVIAGALVGIPVAHSRVERSTVSASSPSAMRWTMAMRAVLKLADGCCLAAAARAFASSHDRRLAGGKSSIVLCWSFTERYLTRTMPILSGRGAWR